MGKDFVKNALSIVFFPAVGYVLAFIYECGFCNVFYIPVYLISVSFINMFIALSCIVGVFIGLLFFLVFFPPQIPDTVISRSLQKLCYPTLVLLISILLFGKDYKEWIVLLILVAFFSFSEFIFPLLTQRKKQTYKEKLEAQEKVEMGIDTFLDYLAQKAGISGRIFIIIVLLTIYTSYAVGRADAKRQVEFLIIDSTPQLVNLRCYNNMLICATFDKEKKQVFKNFYFIEQSSLY